MRIEIHDYDPAWPGLFRETATAFRQALGPLALRIDHIGSTSVPGLAAKPIIDIQISVASLEPVEPYAAGLASLGYEWRPDNPELTKRYFREGPGMRRTHVHVRRSGSFAEQFALLFRDYLRADLLACDYYAAAKRQLALQDWEDVSAFGEAKDPIFWEIIYRANRWSQDTGWEPGVCDA